MCRHVGKFRVPARVNLSRRTTAPPIYRRLKSGRGVWRVLAFERGTLLGEAFLQTCTHAGKLGTPSHEVVAARAEGLLHALAGEATRPEVLELHLEDLQPT